MHPCVRVTRLLLWGACWLGAEVATAQSSPSEPAAGSSAEEISPATAIPEQADAPPATDAALTSDAVTETDLPAFTVPSDGAVRAGSPLAVPL